MLVACTPLNEKGEWVLATFYRVQLALDDPGPVINQNFEIIPVPTVVQIRTFFASLRARFKFRCCGGVFEEKSARRKFGKIVIDAERKKSIEGLNSKNYWEMSSLKVFPSCSKLIERRFYLLMEEFVI